MSTESLAKHLADQRLASRIWQRDLTAFAADTAVQAAVRKRLGWLDAPAGMTRHLADIQQFRAEIQRDGLTDVYLLGMGGSSLCAEVLRDVTAVREKSVTLTVLDTTDERAIRRVTEALVPDRSLFIVASKSGGTAEVSSLEHHFWAVMATQKNRGRHFVAITDPGTSLAVHATTVGYRKAFLNPADIGGRYSALSLFGLVPAALCGLDPAAMLASASRLADRTRSDDPDNPGLALGAFMGGLAAEGRDKLTLLIAKPLAPLGAWIEQLVAESTGKNGRGVLPIVDEPLGRPGSYGADRAFVAVVTDTDSDVRTAARKLKTEGHPVFVIETRVASLGAEFFRWEFATAVAGAVLQVNPFDEPNVRDAKLRTQAQLDARKTTGAFRFEPPLEQGPGYSRREHRPAGTPIDTEQPGRYLALLDYLPAAADRAPVIARLRGMLRDRLGIATTYGVGPRYLHSTGQYHKGGPDTGLFLLLSAADASATPIPGTDLSFSTLKYAQALGDFDALVAAGREVIHYHIDDPTADFRVELERVVLGLK